MPPPQTKTSQAKHSTSKHVGGGQSIARMSIARLAWRRTMGHSGILPVEAALLIARMCEVT
jgi:hypothetical protein